MRKNILLIAAILSMFVFSLQVAEPAAAASWKVVDHGSFKFKDSNNSMDTFKWTTYQKGVNYVELMGYAYYPKPKISLYYYIYLQKVSKTKIKITGKIISKNSNIGFRYSQGLGTHYGYTKLTAAQYYWRIFRSGLKKIVYVP